MPGPTLKGNIVRAGLAALLLLGVACDADAGPRAGPSPGPSSTPTTTPRPIAAYRAFTDSSYWNTPLPSDAPVDPNSSRIIGFLKRDNTKPYLLLSGTGTGGRWGTPVYWAQRGDHTYDVRNVCRIAMPAEFRSAQVPQGARPDPTSDSDFTVYNLRRRVVYAFWHASYDSSSDRWSSCGGTVYYLGSNGLDGALPQSDQPRNIGHRGVPPPTYAVLLSEIQSGTIRHVLEIRVNSARRAHVFPMSGHEGHGASAPDAPPEGARIRIKPSVDLASLHLSAPALVIARALQTYGAVIGDQTGGPATLNVENTVAEGRGQLWRGVLSRDVLSAIGLDMFEVVKLGYGA